MKINGEIINCDMIGHIPTINSVPNVQVVMRLHFLVHSWINMYVVREGDTDIATNSELVGYRMRERSDATR